MKKNVLKPHGRKRERYALKAFLWGMVISAFFVIPSMIISKGMYLYFGDYNVQVIPFYRLMVKAIHSGEFGWNWTTDLGSSLIGGYSFYNLGSPFFWLLLLFPSDAVPYVMGPLTIVKYGLASLTAYTYLKRYTRNKNNAVIGAMLYAFSGAAIYNMVFHFIDSMVLFPLLLAALDKHVYENKRGIFAGMAALCAITNYYFFAGEVVFCLIYWIVKMATKAYKLDSRRVLHLIFEAVVGTGMAAFILLPTIYLVVGNNRANASALDGWNFWVYDAGNKYVNFLLSFFMPPEMPGLNVYVPEYGSPWSSVTAYLPLFGATGVFAIIFNKHKNKWLRVFYGVCAVFMMVPVLNSSFQMFTNYTYFRWFFMLLLIMSLGSVTALEDPSTNWKKPAILNFVITLFIIVAIGLTFKTETDEAGHSNHIIGLSGSTPHFWIYAAVAMINIALFMLFIALYKKNRTAFKRYSSLIVSAALLVTIASSYVPNEVVGITRQDIQGYGYFEDIEDAGIDDIQDWRSDSITQYTYSPDMYDADSVGTEDYAMIDAVVTNVVNQRVYESPDNAVPEGDNSMVFWRIPAFGIFHSLVNGSITNFYNGAGFERATLSNMPISLYGYRTLLGTKYMFTRSDDVLPLTTADGESLMPGWKHLKKWNSFDIYENEYVVPFATTFDKFMLSAEFESIPIQYRHLALLDTLIISSVDQMYEMTAMGMQQVHPEDLDFTRDGYFKNCETRIAAGCYDFSRDKKGFEFKINTEENEEYVFVSVPFDLGWSAEVNGEETDIELIDYGFMTVRVPANQESTVRFNYHTRGTFYGIFASLVCLIMLVIYLAVVKLGNARELEEEKKRLEAKNEEKPETEDNNKAEAVKKDENTSEEKPADESGKDEGASKTEEKTENAGDEEDLDNMTIFDIVKQTEEQTMMHVYKRVPVVLERGSGSVAYDINDKRYIDFTSGIGVNALGYSDGRWIEAVEKQLGEVQHMSNLYYNTTQIQLAELLCMKTGFSRVFFANSGAEANECAIKIARKYGSDRLGEKHTHIITLENSFHGRTITTLAATGQDVFHKHFTPFTEGFSFAKANDMDSIRSKTTEDTCAVMIELIQGEGGVNPLDKEFVTELAQYCKENDLLLIVDEIQTGIGRTGKLYCYENYGIEPDVITSAKALSGGLPLSACLCSEKLKDVLTPGTNGTTFGGNPIACAAATRILSLVADDEFLADVCEKGDYIRERIKTMKGVSEVRGMGMMIGIVLEKNNAGEVLAKCAENGLLVLTAKELIRLLPPLNIDYEDIDEGLDILEASIAQTLGDE